MTDGSPEAVRKCVERAMTRNPGDIVFFCAAEADGAEVVTGPRREIHKADRLDGRLFVTAHKSLWKRCGSYAAEVCRRQSLVMGGRG